jgi:hypothetical protein
VGLLAVLTLAAVCPAGAPLPEGDAYVRGLVSGQRGREEALSRYTYDATEVREQLDARGRVSRRETRGFEVFHVRGRPVRRLVSRNGRALPPAEREKEDRRARELAEALRKGNATAERPGVRLSHILERYHFTAAGREDRQGRCLLVFDFAARPGDFDLARDALLRRLAGRLWVDEEERAVAEVEVRNTSDLRFALGLGAKVHSVLLRMEFARMEEGVWLPRRIEAAAEGRKLLFKRFHARTLTSFSNYRRFEVETEERVRP